MDLDFLELKINWLPIECINGVTLKLSTNKIYGLIYYTAYLLSGHPARGSLQTPDGGTGRAVSSTLQTLKTRSFSIMEQISTWAIERENETEEKSRVDNSRLTGSVKVTEIHGPAAQSVHAHSLHHCDML